MTQLFHYMPMRYADVLLREKKDLVPRTPLMDARFSQFIDIPQGSYTFCFPHTPYPENWKKTGWLERLTERVGEGLIFSFEAPQTTVIMDATQLYGVADKMRSFPFSNEQGLEGLFKKFAPELKKAFSHYQDSRVLLSDYENDYFLHEAIIDVAILHERLSLFAYIETGV
jgi:hypothetical protein